jgi:hypothetical protein
MYNNGTKRNVINEMKPLFFLTMRIKIVHTPDDPPRGLDGVPQHVVGHVVPQLHLTAIATG